MATLPPLSNFFLPQKSWPSNRAKSAEGPAGLGQSRSDGQARAPLVSRADGPCKMRIHIPGHFLGAGHCPGRRQSTRVSYTCRGGARFQEQKRSRKPLDAAQRHPRKICLFRELKAVSCFGEWGLWGHMRARVFAPPAAPQLASLRCGDAQQEGANPRLPPWQLVMGAWRVSWRLRAPSRPKKHKSEGAARPVQAEPLAVGAQAGAFFKSCQTVILTVPLGWQPRAKPVQWFSKWRSLEQWQSSTWGCVRNATLDLLDQTLWEGWSPTIATLATPPANSESC